MAPLLSFLIPAFAGDFQGQNPLVLADIYSSGGSLNLHMDRNGQIRTTPGWTELGAYAPGGGSTTFCVAITGAPQISSPTSNYIVAFLINIPSVGVTSTRMVSSIDGGVTWASEVVLSGHYIPDFVVFGDRLYVAGMGQPRYFENGTATAISASQLAAPTLASGGTGILRGNYRYRIIPVKANKERKRASAISAAFQAELDTIDVTWIADPDTDVLGYEVWRTTGTSLDLYYDTYVDGRTTVTLTDDNLPDSVLITREVLAVVAPVGDVPPTAHHVMAHKQRVWWMNTDDNPRRGYYSEPGEGDAVDQTLGYIDFDDDHTQADEIVGGTGEFKGAGIVWMRNSIWSVTGTGQFIGPIRDWRRRRTNATTGTLSSRTVIRVPKGAKYSDETGQIRETSDVTLAFLTPFKDIRLFDGDSDTIISFAKKSTLDEMNLGAGSVTKFKHASWAAHDPDNGHIIWGIPYGAAQGTVNRAVVWDYVRGTWHEWTNWTLGHAVMTTFGAEQLRIGGEAVAGDDVEFYDFWDEDSWSRGVASNLSFVFQSKPIFPPVQEGGPPDMSHEKIFEAGIFLFDLIEDQASPADISAGLTPYSADNSVSFEYGTSSNAEGAGRQYIRAQQGASGAIPGKYLVSSGCRIKVFSTSGEDIAPWRMNGIQLLYRLRTGQRR